MEIQRIIMVGSQDEVFEELPPENVELYVIQTHSSNGSQLQSVAKEVYLIEEFDDEQVLAGAQYFTHNYDIDALFCFTEYGLLPAANAAKKLSLPGIDLYVTELCRNKWLLREKLLSTLYHVPFVLANDYSDIEKFSQSFGFPIVLKDPSGVGSLNVKVCTTLLEASVFFSFLQKEGYKTILLEKFVSGIEYSVETLSIRGRHELVGITEKHLILESLVEKKHIYPANLTRVKEILLKSYSLSLLELIDHKHGPMHIEIKVENNECHLIEINNRPGGDYIWDMVNKVSGVNLISETISYFSNGWPSPNLRKERCRYEAMSYIALLKPLPPILIQENLSDKTNLDRVQCKYLNVSKSHEVTNSFERLGFILIGEDKLTKINTVLPVIDQWIESQLME